MLKNRDMVQEFLRPRSNQWEGMIRRLLEKWTVDTWANVYRFRKEGRMVARRTDRWVDGVGTRFVVNTPLRRLEVIKHLKSDSSIVPGIL